MSQHLPTLLPLLERFAAAATPHPAYRHSHRHDGQQGGPHLVISAIVHGDEMGSLPGFVQVLEALRSGVLTYGGKLTLFLGNPEAAKENRRFLEDDLNRVFVPNDPRTSHEVRRAQEIMPLLDEADVYLDLHQTIEPTQSPFYIFPWDPLSAQWVRALGGASVWVTRRAGQPFMTGAVCTDDYARARGVPGITLELSQKGFAPEAARLTERVIRDALRLGDALRSAPTALESAASAQPPLQHHETVFRQTFSSPGLTLRAGLENFTPVREGELLSAPGTEPLVAPRDGRLLFPKYPPRNAYGEALDPRPGEIYRIVSPLSEDPSVLWG